MQNTGGNSTSIPETALHPWASRNGHWSGENRKPAKIKPRLAGGERPLILCGHGVHLSVDRGTLRIRDGLTHYPQERAEYRFFKGDERLPKSIIVLDATGGLSFGVMAWLAEQNIPLFRIDWAGNIASIVGGSGFSQNLDKLRWQIETRANFERRIEFCCDLIIQKILTSVDTLRLAVPASAARDAALEKAEGAVERLEARAVRSIEELRLVEAGAAGSYFRAWRGSPLNWRSKTRHPIPDSWLKVVPRRSWKEGGSPNRNARHPVNAMLNYAYAVAHAQLHAELALQGFDPRVGIMHEMRTDGLAFVLDMIETRRPLVDRAVLKFLFANIFSGADFAIREDGVCRLSPELARRVCQMAAVRQDASALLASV